MKLKSHLDFTDIPSIPSLIKDFLNGKFPEFNEDRFSLENFELKIEAKQKFFGDSKRKNIVKVLEKQLKDLELSDLQKANISLLLKNNCFTVTTGHQLNLFTGPVFFIYKILQTVKTSAFLKEKFPASDFVPVFWMATEDHDFEEINHFKTDHNYYEFNAPSGGVVGKIEIENTSFITRFEEEFKDDIYGTELILLLKNAFTKGKTLTEATRFLVNELFSKYGLLILDGDDASLKSEMKTVFADELENQSLLKSAQKNIDLLTELYGKVQVNPREINLFYLTETRNRIDFDGENYYILDTDLKLSKDEILQELQNHPEKFSPNAVMRPVYQESILPNIAYIGGNAEIMYWLELKDYFAKISLPFPVLIPRNSMLLLPEKIFEKLKKLNLTVADYFENFNTMVQNKLVGNHEILKEINSAEEALKVQFKSLKKEAEKTDVTFYNLVDAEEKRQLKSFERMTKRLLRAEKIKESELLVRLENLFLEIHPGKTWQERVYNFSVFYRESGADFLDGIYAEMNVEKSELIILEV